MGNPNDMEIGYGVDVDDASFRRGINATEKLENAVEKTAKTAKIAGRALGDFTKDVSKSARNATSDIQDLRKELLKAADAGKKARSSASGGGGAAIGRATQAAGALTGGQLGGVGDILNAADAISDLKSSAVDAIGPLKNSASGLVSLGVAGAALAAAMVIAAIALKDYTDAASEQAAQINATIDAQRKVGQEIARGNLTSEDAAARIAELNAVREEEANRLAELEKANQAATDQLGDLNVAFINLGGARGALELVDERFQSLTKNVNESKGLIGDYDAEITALEDALKSGKLEASDAAVVEQQLEAARAGTTDATTDAAKETEQAAKKQIKAAEDAAKAQEQAANKIASAYTKLENTVDDISTDLVRSIADAKVDTKRAFRDLFQDVSAESAEAGRAITDAQLEEQIKFGQESAKIQRDNQRAIKNIFKQANRDQTDLLAERDFLALDQLSKQTKRELEDVGDNAEAVQDEREIARKDEQAAVKRQNAIVGRERVIANRKQQQNLRRNLRDEIIDLNKAGRRKVTDAVTGLNREIALAQEGANALVTIERNMWAARIGLANAGTGGSTGGGAMNLTINGANMSTGTMRTVALDVFARLNR